MKPDDGDQANLCLCSKLCTDSPPGFQKIAHLKQSGLMIYHHLLKNENVSQATQDTDDVKVIASDTRNPENVFILCNTNDTDITSTEYLPEIEKAVTCIRCRQIMKHAFKLLQKVRTIDRHAIFGICDHCKPKDQTYCKCYETTKKFFQSKSEAKECARNWLSKDKSMSQHAGLKMENIKKLKKAHSDFIDDKFSRREYALSECDFDIRKLCRESKSPGVTRASSIITEKSKKQALRKRGQLSTLIINKSEVYPSDSDYSVGKSTFLPTENQEAPLIQKHKENVGREFLDDFSLHRNDCFAKDDRTSQPVQKRLKHFDDDILPLGSSRQYAHDAEIDSTYDQKDIDDQYIQGRNKKLRHSHALGDEQLMRPLPNLDKQNTHVGDGILKQTSVMPTASVDKTLEKGFMFSFPKEDYVKVKMKRQKSSSELIKDTQDMIQEKIEEKKRKIEEERFRKAKEKEQKQLSRYDKAKSALDKTQPAEGTIETKKESDKAKKLEYKQEETAALENDDKKDQETKEESDNLTSKTKESELKRLKPTSEDSKSEPRGPKSTPESKGLKAQFSKIKSKAEWAKSESKGLKPELNKTKAEASKSEIKGLKPEFNKSKYKAEESKSELRGTKLSSKESTATSKESKPIEPKTDFKELKAELKKFKSVKEDSSTEPRQPKKEKVKHGKDKSNISPKEKETQIDSKDSKKSGIKNEPDKTKQDSAVNKEEEKNRKSKKSPNPNQDLNRKNFERANLSQDLLILELVRLKQQQKKRTVSQTKEPKDSVVHKHGPKGLKAAKYKMCSNSELDLEFEVQKRKIDVLSEFIKGQKLAKLKENLTEYANLEDEKGLKPILFQSTYNNMSENNSVEVLELPTSTPADTKKPKTQNLVDREQPTKGVLHYALSDRTFIEKGWTVLPTEKVVRRMNVYRMRPAHPEFDWFEHNKKKGLMLYDTGERLAEINDNGRGRWYYKNGRVALEYYDAEELNAQQRFVIYSNGESDERGRPRPYTILATFDFLGNGIVFDHGGKIRLKYNQTEGVVLDRNIGPASHWKWHTLNDPPVLQQVMIDTQLSHKDPEILKMGKHDEKTTRQDDEEMMAVEFDNFIKEKSKKLAQSFKPFQIKMKALKINENFSLKVLDQASVYLIYRDGLTNIKLNIGMLLDNKEIVDTDTAELGEVSNNVEKLPACTDSIAGLQKSVEYAQRFERARMERSRKLRPPQPSSSADKLTAAASHPMRQQLLSPMRTVRSTTTTANYCNCKSRKPSSNNMYYDNSLC